MTIIPDASYKPSIITQSFPVHLQFQVKGIFESPVFNGQPVYQLSLLDKDLAIESPDITDRRILVLAKDIDSFSGISSSEQPSRKYSDIIGIDVWLVLDELKKNEEGVYIYVLKLGEFSLLEYSGDLYLRVGLHSDEYSGMKELQLKTYTKQTDELIAEKIANGE